MTINDEPPLQKWPQIIRLTAHKSLANASKIIRSCQKLFFRLTDLAHENKIFLIRISILTVIAFVPWISEASVNTQIYTDLKKYSETVDPLKAGQFAQVISQYAPGIDVQAQDVALKIMNTNEGSYTLAQQLSLNASENIAQPQRQQATYVVQNGESVTQVAQRFNLHVASILDVNNIKPEDANKIKEGTILAIPSSDTSTSDEWLVAIQEAQEAQKAADAAEAKKLAQKKTAASVLASSKQTASAYSSVDRSGLSVPISSRGISQSFGRGHTGIDYMANIGTPVRAAAGGKIIIVSTGWSGGYGNQIVVDHGDGRTTRYAHLSSINVRIGQIVGSGETIGLSGSTGRSTGPHLHFELIINGRPVSPF